MSVFDKPTIITYKKQKYIISTTPSNDTISDYVSFLTSHNVSLLIRTCEPTYDITPIKAAGIKCVDLQFLDGQYPPKNIIDSWRGLIMKERSKNPYAVICVHCISGYGRAPTLVAASLIDDGMDNFDAVLYIRKKRPGAINSVQLTWLENYKTEKESPCIVC